jgi:hypothetical protein
LDAGQEFRIKAHIRNSRCRWSLAATVTQVRMRGTV